MCPCAIVELHKAGNNHESHGSNVTNNREHGEGAVRNRGAYLLFLVPRQQEKFLASTSRSLAHLSSHALPKVSWVLWPCKFNENNFCNIFSTYKMEMATYSGKTIFISIPSGKAFIIKKQAPKLASCEYGHVMYFA